MRISNRDFVVRFEPLGDKVYGYISYDLPDGVSQIHINSEPPEWRQIVALIHELYHLVLKKRRKVMHGILHQHAFFTLLWDKFGRDDKRTYAELVNLCLKLPPLVSQKMVETILLTAKEVWREKK
jgi:hypothetical protein